MRTERNQNKRWHIDQRKNSISGELINQTNIYAMCEEVNSRKMLFNSQIYNVHVYKYRARPT